MGVRRLPRGSEGLSRNPLSTCTSTITISITIHITMTITMTITITITISITITITILLLLLLIPAGILLGLSERQWDPLLLSLTKPY